MRDLTLIIVLVMLLATRSLGAATVVEALTDADLRAMRDAGRTVSVAGGVVLLTQAGGAIKRLGMTIILRRKTIAFDAEITGGGRV